jgi:hypothetical protein
MAAKTVSITNVTEAKAVAAEYGVKWPEGPGKPPVVRLWNALADAGVTIKGDYLKAPKPKLAPVAPGQRDYDITREVTKADSRGRKRTVNDTIRLNVAQLREMANAKGLRGQVGNSRIREALAKMVKDGALTWSDEDIANARIAPVPVVSVATSVIPELPKVPAVTEKPKAEPVKAPSKPRKPRAAAKAKAAPKVATVEPAKDVTEEKVSA